MKRLVIGIILSLLTLTAFAQDFALLETLIAAHKSQYNHLKDRKNNEKSNVALYSSVRNLTNDYDKIKTNLSKRMKQGYDLLYFTKDVIEIGKMSSDVGNTLIELGNMAFTNAHKSPFILIFYYEIYSNVVVETKYCVNLLIQLTTQFATDKQRYEWINAIKTSLVYIDYVLRRGKDQIEYCLFYGKGIKNFREFLKDENFKKAADKIIKDLKKN